MIIEGTSVWVPLRARVTTLLWQFCPAALCYFLSGIQTFCWCVSNLEKSYQNRYYDSIVFIEEGVNLFHSLNHSTENCIGTRFNIHKLKNKTLRKDQTCTDYRKLRFSFLGVFFWPIIFQDNFGC